MPNDYKSLNMILLLFTTLCCCCANVPAVITAIIGVVFSNKTSNDVRYGAYQQAVKHSETARMMAIITAILIILGLGVGGYIGHSGILEKYAIEHGIPLNEIP